MEAENDHEGGKRHRRKSKVKRHKKDKSGSSKNLKGKKEKRKLAFSIFKRKKRSSYGKKVSERDPLSKTIQTWKKRWKNKTWRIKWKYLWGKTKWKPSIRKKWNADKKWRRKWMKKILKQWWDKKWRRRWMKRFIDIRWLTRWNRKRLRRRKLWEKRWKKSGAKKMGLTFNEFLLTERRLKALQKQDPAMINRRRRDRHFQKEKVIREQQEKRRKFQEENNSKIFLQRWYNALFEQEFYGPETFGIRPAVIQFKFYMMNALQGLFAFILVLYVNLTNTYTIPPEFTIQGIYLLVYSASAMDFYGSIFGMVTSYHLETYYGRRKSDLTKRKKKNGCFGCCGKKTVSIAAARDASQKEEESVTTLTESQADKIKGGETASPKHDGMSRRRRSKSRESPRRRSSVRSDSILRGSISHYSLHSSRHHHHHHKKRVSNHGDMGQLRRSLRRANASISSGPTTAEKESAVRIKASSKVECKCRGLNFLYCCIVRKSFRAGRSREFINRMGYCSWVLLELAWFLNLFFTAYYSWLSLFYKDYHQADSRCLSYPQQKHCVEFDSLYYFLLAIVGVTFLLRSIFVFVIGMCFSERHLKRCQPADPNEEMASTCSDTDIDYSKVPRQILVPHLLSSGKYPYVIPGPCRPVDYMLAKIGKITEKRQRAKSRAEGQVRKRKKRKDKRRRRILSKYEREKQKMLAGFKQVRRVRVPVEKGRRKPWRIPIAAGVTDVHQLPPELMTTKAREWLYSDSDSTDYDEPKTNEQRRPPPVRMRRKRAKPIDSAVLTVVFDANANVNKPTEELVKHKYEDLSNRSSTDESWSGKSSSLFETASGESSDDGKARKESADVFLELAYIMSKE